VSNPDELRASPLDAQHRALGAKFGPFGGWSMPLEYAGGGVTAEHRAVRESVGLFDVSHLGTATVRGDGARALIDGLLTNDLARIGPGQAQYTLLCNDQGGVIDDLIVYVRADDDVLLIPNASNSAEVLGVVRHAAPSSVTVTDLHADVAIIAVQGPRSAHLLDAVGLPSSLAYMAFADTTWTSSAADVDVTVCRTGYTGEHGYEVLIAADAAPALWDALLVAGQDFGVLPCGLAARDTLRTEMGYPLHGQDLSPTISPVEAGVSWAVGWDKLAFVGREALVAQRAAGPDRRLRGLRATGRGIPRAHMPVLDAGGAVIGEVTSGTFSPTLSIGIALALIPADVPLGAALSIDVRGRPLPVEVVAAPFVDASPR
jgi:aminomethyltransferase